MKKNFLVLTVLLLATLCFIPSKSNAQMHGGAAPTGVAPQPPVVVQPPSAPATPPAPVIVPPIGTIDSVDMELLPGCGDLKGGKCARKDKGCSTTDTPKKDGICDKDCKCVVQPVTIESEDFPAIEE